MGRSLEIAWYGQAMFSISGGGLNVVVDPTPPETGYSYEPVPADVVLITHQHFDHNYLAGVTGSPEVITASGASEVSGVLFEGFDSFHDGQHGKDRGPNIIYTWEQAGITLAHFGDLGHQPAHDVMRKVHGRDIAMIPVGGVFTIDADHATGMVKEIDPRIVFPMHYATSDCLLGVEPVDDFTRNFKGTVREIGVRPIEVKAGALPHQTEVWVLPWK